MDDLEFHLLTLRDEFSKRREKNKRYSLRAFARDLNIHSGLLSRLLTGKRPLTPKTAQKLATKLKLSDKTRDTFVRAAALSQTADKIASAQMQKKRPLAVTRQKIDAETFELISDIEHYAVLEMTFDPAFSSKSTEIASRLGITALEADMIVRRLIDAKLLERRGGRLFKTAERVTTDNKLRTTAAHRKRFRQVLTRASHALTLPISKRSMSSMTMCVAPERLDDARKLIEDFSERLCSLMEEGNRGPVYELAVCLFPLEVAMDRPSLLPTLAAQTVGYA